VARKANWPRGGGALVRGDPTLRIEVTPRINDQKRVQAKRKNNRFCEGLISRKNDGEGIRIKGKGGEALPTEC